MLPYVVLYLFVFIVGACLGSFANVLVYRIPRGLDFVKGRSFCPACGHALSPMDLVPIISWLCLKRKCRYCGAGIAARYPLVETGTGIIAVACAARFGFSSATATVFFICGTLLVLSLIDADTQEIPDGLIIALGVLAVISYFTMPEPGIVARLIGAACVSVPMMLLNLLIPTSFGGGDVKLMAVMGLIMGWKNTLLAMFFALLFGGGYGIYLLVRRKKGRREHFAFGPFLATGCMLALFFGAAMLDWYFGVFW